MKKLKWTKNEWLDGWMDEEWITKMRMKEPLLLMAKTVFP
jgi:hypothetical protein